MRSIAVYYRHYVARSFTDWTTIVVGSTEGGRDDTKNEGELAYIESSHLLSGNESALVEEGTVFFSH